MGERPRRIQRKRTRGWCMPANTVYVGRPSRWGNPYQAGKDGSGNPAYLTSLYRAYIERPENKLLRQSVREALRSKDLACWCPLNQPCHADVLLEVANGDGQRGS